MGSPLLYIVSPSVVSISRNNLFLVRKMFKKGGGRKGKAKATVQVERAPEEDLAETNQDHTEDSNIPGPSPKAKKAKAVPEITGGDGAENEAVPEELKPSEPSPKAKKAKKNANIVPENKSEEEAIASENGTIQEESAPSKEAVAPVLEEELKPSEPSPKAKTPVKNGKKNAKIVPENNGEEEASASDVKPAADESQTVATDSVSIPKETLLIKQKEGEGEAENASVTEELTPPEPSPKAKKGKKECQKRTGKEGQKEK